MNQKNNASDVPTMGELLSKPLSKRQLKKRALDTELVSNYLDHCFDEELKGDAPPSETKKQMKRMRQHPDMPSVIRTLLSFAHPEQYGDDVRRFLSFSLALPNYWELRKDKPKHFVSAETNDLRTHAADFRSNLQRHSDLVHFYLGKLREGKRLSSDEVQSRMDLLLSAITSIHDLAAAKNHHLSFLEKHVPPPTKEPGHRNAREHFCIRALVWKAQQLFVHEDHHYLSDELLRNLGHVMPPAKLRAARTTIVKELRKRLAKGQGLAPEIAVLVSTSLGLREPLTAAFVTNFLRKDKVPTRLL